jgi:hypothetical protein
MEKKTPGREDLDAFDVLKASKGVFSRSHSTLSFFQSVNCVSTLLKASKNPIVTEGVIVGVSHWLVLSTTLMQQNTLLVILDAMKILPLWQQIRFFGCNSY